MYGLYCSIIVTALLCWSHAHISNNTNANLDVGVGLSGRPRPIRTLTPLTNLTEATENKLTLKKTASQANQLEEITNIFSDQVEGSSKKPPIPNDGTVGLGPGLMEGGDGGGETGGNSKFTKSTLNVGNKITTPKVESTSPAETIGSKQKTTDSGNSNNSHRTIGRPGVSEEVIDKEVVPNKLDSSLASNSTEDAKSSKIHARKGAENKKINARKGVDVNTTITRKEVILDDDEGNKTNASSTASSPNQLGTATLSTPAVETRINNGINMPTSVNKTHMLANSSVPHPNISMNSSISATIIPQHPQQNQVSDVKDISSALNNGTILSVPINGTWSDTGSSPKAVGGIISSFPLLKKTPRPKPLITADNRYDTPVVQERTPSQHDYVIPIVVAILAVPMVIVLLLFLYKKGSESWERRHYRRMDFLIDGMYND